MKWILVAEFLFVNSWSRRYATTIHQFRRPQKCISALKSSSDQFSTQSSSTTLESNLGNNVNVYCPNLASELQMPLAAGNFADEDGLLLRRNLEVKYINIYTYLHVVCKDIPFPLVHSKTLNIVSIHSLVRMVHWRFYGARKRRSRRDLFELTSTARSSSPACAGRRPRKSCSAKQWGPRSPCWI